MSDIYIAILEISSGGLAEIVNEKIDSDSINEHDGFSFKVLYSDDDFFQISVCADNKYTTRILWNFFEYNGMKIGGKYNVPVMIETDGGFAGILCTYIFMVSQERIPTGKLYQIVLDKYASIGNDNYGVLQERFYHSERINGFLEFMHYIEKDSEIRCQTEWMIDHTVVYNEFFFSKRNPDKIGAVTFQENLTLLSAKEAVIRGKHTAVLNFANPIEYGGGVLKGAKAQEENICRSSNLYKALSSKKTYFYYKTNQSILYKNQFNSMFLGSDMVIYSPSVMVLKEDIDYRPGFPYSGIEEYSNQPFCVDVITCAAPFFSGLGYILPNGDLQHLFERRIRNILEVAIENQIEVIILGAFGCGAFHNPPDIVADAFRKVLLEARYNKAFDEVIFAVKRTNIICPNIEAFERNFSLFPDINYQGNEQEHRLSWKWKCNCGQEHSWDKIKCAVCNCDRRHSQEVICYNK